MGLRTTTCLGVAVVCALAACQSQKGGAAAEAEAPPSAAPIAAGQYDRVFDAAVWELRDRRFVVQRQDRRFGLIETQPLIASSVVEPWYSDNSTAAQAMESTLNHDRRIVYVTLQPAPSELEAYQAGGPAPTAYEVRVRVEMQRRSLPSKPLTTAAVGGIGARESRRRMKTLRTEEGVQESRWVALGRDPKLEARLLLAIMERAGQMVE